MGGIRTYISGVLLMLLLLTIGCEREVWERGLIERAERVGEQHPDSALALLDSIALPELLSPRLTARWCLLYGRLADRLGTEMPYTNQLGIALAYYREREMRPEEAETGLYLGRSYVEDRRFEQATQAYIDALTTAKAIPDPNRAGYICSYQADLYELDDHYLLAAEKNKESGEYFRQAGNMKSYIRAFVNEGRSYLYTDSVTCALKAFEQAIEVADTASIEDIDGLKAYIYNGMGNAYNLSGEYDLAEENILKAVRLNPMDAAPSYLALADISITKREIEKAEHYLQKASEALSKNEYIPATIAYNRYRINKLQGDFKNALSSYERYVKVEDSLLQISKSVDIYNEEEKYDHLRLQSENVNLRYQNQKSYTLILALILAGIILGLFSMVIVNIKNRLIQGKEEEIDKLNQDIYRLCVDIKEKEDALCAIQDRYSRDDKEKEKVQAEIDELKERLTQMREKRITYSNLYKKLISLSKSMRSKPSKEPLTDKIWEEIELLIQEVYPEALLTLTNASLTQTEKRLCLLTLFRFDNNDIANLLCIMPTSADMTRYRIRKKLHWSGNISFYDSLVNSR